jgi:hypothetical protein
MSANINQPFDTGPLAPAQGEGKRIALMVSRGAIAPRVEPRAWLKGVTL